jgi:hypothetical protein
VREPSIALPIEGSFVRFLSVTPGQEPAGLLRRTVSTAPRPDVLRLAFDPEGLRKVGETARSQPA